MGISYHGLYGHDRFIVRMHEAAHLHPACIQQNNWSMMGGSIHQLQVNDLRLGEFDIGGVLYHANYFHLYEMAREALLRDGGTPYAQLVEHGSHLAVTHSEQEFFAPIVYGAPLEIQTTITEISRTSVTFRYEITSSRSSKNPIHLASTTHVHVKKGENGVFRPTALPETLIPIFKRFQQANV